MRPSGRSRPGPALLANGGQRMFPLRGIGGSRGASPSLGLAPARSRRSSSRRARMVAKSSAARGRFTASPPSLVEFWWRSTACGPVLGEGVGGLILGRKSQALSAHRALDETLGGSDKMGRCGGIKPHGDQWSTRRRRRRGPGVRRSTALNPAAAACATVS